MTFSCGAGRKRQRGQTRRPWAGCCCGKLLLSFASSAVTHTHSGKLRERETHTSVRFRYTNGAWRAHRPTHRWTERPGGTQRRKYTWAVMASSASLWISSSRCTKACTNIIQSRSAISSHARLLFSLSLSFYAYSARERSGPALARSAQVSRPRSPARAALRAHLCWCCPPACLPACLCPPHRDFLLSACWTETPVKIITHCSNYS